jgi:mono/diheme cytochrome c family protein
VPRAALNIAGESCAVCHGSGSDFDPVKMHK